MFYFTSTPRRRIRWLRAIYKYPQAEFPYARLREKTPAGPERPEFELLDTGGSTRPLF